MPKYDYQCKKCEHIFERNLKIADRYSPYSESCPSCSENGHIEMYIGSPLLIADQVRLGRMPINRKLQEKFRQIHDNTYGSQLDKTSTLTPL